MRPEYFPQRRVDEVRRRVISPRRVALFRIHDGGDLIADLDRSAFDFRFVKDQSG
jgi:hypothetical protein